MDTKACPVTGRNNSACMIKYWGFAMNYLTLHKMKLKRKIVIII